MCSSLITAELCAYVASASTPISRSSAFGSILGAMSGARRSGHQGHRSTSFATMAPDSGVSAAPISPVRSASSSTVCCNLRPLPANSVEMADAHFCKDSRHTRHVHLQQLLQRIKVPGSEGLPASSRALCSQSPPSHLVVLAPRAARLLVGQHCLGDISRPAVKLLVKGKHGLLPADR